MATTAKKTRMIPAFPPIPLAMAYAIAPTAPAAGIVTIQAETIRPATLQRTSVFLPTPDPRIDPVATWVVDREYPKWLDRRMADADAASAAMPWGDSISVSPLPMVRMTRQPPIQVPRLMARAQETITQLGALDPLASDPLATRARVITPIVFWASLVPWASDTMDAEPIWPIRNPCDRVWVGTSRDSR